MTRSIVTSSRMSPEPYPAAQAAAPRVHGYLTALFADGNAHQNKVPLPDEAFILRVLDVAFWASLRREEGVAPTISLALVPGHLADVSLQFARPLPLAAPPLARLAPAVERPGVHLGVWQGPDGDVVWGSTMTVPAFVAVVEVVAPGLIVVKVRRDPDAAKYTNILVLEGDDAQILDTRVPLQPDCPTIVSSLFGFESPASWVASADLLVQLATSMRAHGRGGALIVLPAGDEAWRASVATPLTYELSPPWTVLRDLDAATRPSPDRRWALVSRPVAAVAGLTAVDGATLLSHDHDVLAFGAKLVRRKGWPAIERIIISEPIEGRGTREVHPVQVGGTRHLSAAQFVHDQRDASALVASQDGRFTIFNWSPELNAVTAHRVEALLL